VRRLGRARNAAGAQRMAVATRMAPSTTHAQAANRSLMRASVLHLRLRPHLSIKTARLSQIAEAAPLPSAGLVSGVTVAGVRKTVVATRMALSTTLAVPASKSTMSPSALHLGPHHPLPHRRLVTTTGAMVLPWVSCPRATSTSTTHRRRCSQRTQALAMPWGNWASTTQRSCSNRAMCIGPWSSTSRRRTSLAT